MDNWQTKAAEFSQNHNLHHSPSVYALDLISELGEVAKEILLGTDYGKRPFQATPDHLGHDLSGELGDALYSLCQLATAAGVDLDDAFTATLQKYEQRWQEKRNFGSMNAER
jgi:NTP pyrophosphatase (non-canonical NTP hydrolase)